MTNYTPTVVDVVKRLYGEGTGPVTDYTPTPEEARRAASRYMSPEDFDRMLAEVIRAAKAEAWWEGQRAGWEECADPDPFVNDLHDAKTPNPYRKEPSDG